MLMMKVKNSFDSILFFIVLISAFLLGNGYSQVSSGTKRYIRIGSLQSHFTAYGSERAWNNSFYEGLRWPAQYQQQDNSIIKRFWMGTDGFTDTDGRAWSKYCIYFAQDYTDNSLFPIKMQQTAKFKPPDVFVDGVNTTAPYLVDVDNYNENLKADRVVENVVNTTMGLTMTRRILAFSQQYHDNYFIKEFIFVNTGNTDYNDEIELNATLNDVYISWGTRYSAGREGATIIGDGMTWGQHMWTTRRGEDYPDHVDDPITESNPIVDWLRCGFGWAGQSGVNSYDNIGAPNTLTNGRLYSPHHVGVVSLHVDNSSIDHTDNPYQPFVLGWHAGDTYPSLGDMVAETPMIQLYKMISGNPYPTNAFGDTWERFAETYLTSITDPIDPFEIHQDGGGTNIWVSYGPFTLAPGDTIVIIEAEGINGLSREMCEEIGAIWLNNSGPFILPDGNETSDADEYKNTWIYTGQDSIMETFGRAKRNLDSQYEIPQPPLPPPVFEVTSGGDRISLSWQASPSEVNSDFGGYRLFRSVAKPDTTYDEIFACGLGTDNPEIVNAYYDRSPVRGFSYYYYLVAFNDGSNNQSGETNPTGQLHSGRFYTQTTTPAFLSRQAGKSLSQIRVVPNPFNIKSRRLNYPGEPDKIAFLNIPAFCKIRIYTERGDLIQTINHNDGSGDEFWKSVTSSRQNVVSGIYIAHFEVTQDYADPETGQILYKKGDNSFQKFVVIR
jgi:hypothetical protein